MRYQKYLFVSLCVGAFSQSLAAEPQIPPSAPVVTAPVQATPVPSGPVATPANAAKTESPPDKVAEDKDKSLRRLGYKPEVRNGRTMYCRTETHLGSRFDTKVCGAPEEITDATIASKDMTNRAQKGIGNGPAK